MTFMIPADRNRQAGRVYWGPLVRSYTKLSEKMGSIQKNVQSGNKSSFHPSPEFLPPSIR